MYPMSHPLGNPSVNHPPPGNFRSQDITLLIRQEPKDCQLTVEGKEKARKAVDPPPVVQLHVSPRVDPAQHFMQSPYVFLCATLYKADKDEPWDGHASKGLLGTLASSLHRLKDVDNKDGGFFVFGDISVKVVGTFRLHFSLFDLHKDTGEVQFLQAIISQTFKVTPQKDYLGVEESTYLSRAFSDQGVRLRLRKESSSNRTRKRSYPFDAEVPTTILRPPMLDYGQPTYPDRPNSNKRYHIDTERAKKIPYPRHTGSSTTSYTQGFDASQFEFAPVSPYQQYPVHPSYGASQYPVTSGNSSAQPVGQSNVSSTFNNSPPFSGQTQQAPCKDVRALQSREDAEKFHVPLTMEATPSFHFGAGADKTQMPLSTEATSVFPFTAGMDNASTYLLDSVHQTTSASSNSVGASQRYSNLQHQSYSHTPYSSHRVANSSPQRVSEDTPGLSGYATTSNTRISEELLPGTASGMQHSLSLAELISENPGFSRQSHNSMVYEARMQHRSQLPNPSRPSGQFENQT